MFLSLNKAIRYSGLTNGEEYLVSLTKYPGTDIPLLNFGQRYPTLAAVSVPHLRHDVEYAPEVWRCRCYRLPPPTSYGGEEAVGQHPTGVGGVTTQPLTVHRRR